MAQNPPPASLTDMSPGARTQLLMERHGLRPVKSLGQNFLVDGNLAARLVGVALQDTPARVLEVGAGLGALTVPLARSGAQVVAYEKDARLEAPLRELLEGFHNVDLRMGDFLDTDLTGMTGPDTVAVGNLPYYITTPILEKFLLTHPPLGAIIATMQLEVARRILAAPGTAEYGSLTVFCAYHLASVEQVATLPPEVFRPRPGVTSAAVRMVPRREPPAGVVSPERFFTALRAAFGYRRKTLRRALATAPATGLDGEAATEVLTAAGIAPDRRGETLCLEEFVALGNALAARAEPRG